MPNPTGGNILQELWVNIRADIGSLRQGFRQGETEVKSFVGRLGAASKELQTLGRNITLVSGALAGLGALATSVFAKFEQSMANTQSVVGATSKELQELTEFAREMGRTTIFTASEAADAMYYLGQAGFKTKDIMSSLEGTLQLAVATQQDLATTTGTVVATLNQFGLGADQAARVSNVFASATANSLANMEKLKEALKFVGPVANQFGEQLESTVAQLSKLFDAGITASIAGTQLRQIFLRLAAPTKAAEDALSKLSLKADDISPQFQSLTSVIQKFQNAIPPNRLRQSIDELRAIFGIRAVAPFIVLLQQGAQGLTDFQNKITGTQKAAQQAAIQIDTLKGAAKLLLSALQDAAITIGETLRPAIKFVTDVIRDLVQVFNELPKAIKQTLVIVPSVVTALGLIVGPLLLLSSTIPKVITGFGAMKIAFGAAAGPVGILTAALLTLGGVLLSQVGQERRRREEIQKSIRLTRERVDAMKEEKEGINKLASEFLTLHSQQQGSNKLSERQRQIISEINSVYPDLIDNTGDYETALNGIKTASSLAAEQVQILTKAQKDLTSAKLTLQLVELNNQYQELVKETKKGGFFENFGKDPSIYFGSVKDELEGVLNTFDLLSKISKPSLSGFGNIGETVVDAGNLQRALEQSANEGDRLGQAVSDLSSITTLISQKQIELNKLKGFELVDNYKLTKQQKERKDELEKEIQALEKLEDVFTKAIEKATRLKETEDQIKKIKEQLKDIQTFGAPGRPDIDNSAIEAANLAEIRYEEAKQEQLKLIREDALEEQQLAEKLAFEAKLEEERQFTEFIEKENEERAKLAQDLAEAEIEAARKAAREREREARRWGNAIAEMSEIVGQYAAQASFKLKDAWKTALKALIDVIVNTYKHILQAQIFAALALTPANYLAAARAAAGIALLTGLGEAAKIAIDQAAVGAKIDRSGLLNVHAGEVVVPASVSRATRNEYRNNLLGNKTISEPNNIFEDNNVSQDKQRGLTIAGDLVLVNPQVDDDRYWAKVLDNRLVPVEFNRNKRFNRR